jgi:hypothetical protein
MLLACSVHLEQAYIYFTATVNEDLSKGRGEIPRSRSSLGTIILDG